MAYEANQMSQTPPQTPLGNCGYEDIAGRLDTVANAALEERTSIRGYEIRIRELEAENAELLKDNAELLLLLHSDGSVPTVQAEKAMEKVQQLQDTLVNEREAFAVREEGLTARIWGLEAAVTDSLGDLLRERRIREEIEWRERSRMGPAALNGVGGVGFDVMGRMQRVTNELEKRNTEIKNIREITEKGTQAAESEIRKLRQETKSLSMLKTHANEMEMELDMLKDGMKRIERVAIMYAPLGDDMGLLDAIEAWKKEFVGACNKRKRRKKKEEKRGMC